MRDLQITHNSLSHNLITEFEGFRAIGNEDQKPMVHQIISTTGAASAGLIIYIFWWWTPQRRFRQGPPILFFVPGVILNAERPWRDSITPGVSHSTCEFGFLQSISIELFKLTTQCD